MNDQPLPTTHKTGYRIAGGVLILFSSPLLIPALDGAAPPGVRVGAVMFHLSLTAVGLFLLLRRRRTRWDANRRAVIEEKLWPWGGRQMTVLPLESFAEVEVVGQGVSSRPGSKGYTSGILVRVRHESDSKHFLPGERSWVLEAYPSIAEHREEALQLARRAAQTMGLPLDNRLDRANSAERTSTRIDH